MVTREQILELLYEAAESERPECKGYRIQNFDLDYFVKELNNLIAKEIGTVNGDEFEDMFQKAGAHR